MTFHVWKGPAIACTWTKSEFITVAKTLVLIFYLRRQKQSVFVNYLCMNLAWLRVCFNIHHTPPRFNIKRFKIFGALSHFCRFFRNITTTGQVIQLFPFSRSIQYSLVLQHFCGPTLNMPYRNTCGASTSCMQHVLLINVCTGNTPIYTEIDQLQYQPAATYFHPCLLFTMERSWWSEWVQS